jgi:alkanesulfonate monooxygenase SsuD/methylene tetrahydromethanopterin reductase-like flavin-dependent oxidoreductase (luciferase family)
MLAALAAATRRARIGPAVTYAFDPAAHHPSWLAKRAVTIDHLSHGRLALRLAVGAGDAATRSAWARHGIPYPPGAERVEALEDAVLAMRALWRGDPVEADGRAFSLRGAVLAPPPVQRPGPPIWIAAMRPRALALTARRADGWEASFVTPAAFAALAARLDTLLVGAGRAPADVRRSVEVDVVVAGSRAEQQAWTRRFADERGVPAGHAIVETALAGDANAIAARIDEYAAAGATDLMLGFADTPETGMLERFAREVIPRLSPPRR